MSSPIQRKLLYISLILSTAFLFGCGSDRDKAEKLLTDGEALMKSGDKLAEEGHTKLRQYMSDAKMAAFPSNREQIRPTAQEAADLFGKSGAAFHEAARKYEEVRELATKEVGKEFLSLKLQAIHKMAEAREVAKELALIPLDPSINELRALETKVFAVDGRLKALVKESKELNERANKLMKDNP